VHAALKPSFIFWRTVMNHLQSLVDARATRRLIWCAAAMLLGAAAAHAQTGAGASVIYPAKGQSAKQQDQDRYECHTWARGQSGFDPTQAPQSAAPAQSAAATTTPSPSGAPVSGMAAGAMGGAAVAELTHHDAGRGAAAGAIGGAVIQRVKQQQAAQQQQAKQQAAQQQASQQQASVRSQQRATYERAMGACMEGRGYTVK
jgi:hypothetical protein